MIHIARSPEGLEKLPLRHRYEIMRVLLYAGVDMSDFLVSPGVANIEDYTALWEHLRRHPALEDKEFPKRTPEDVWAASVGTFHSGFNGVVLSAKLYFRESEEGPLFDLRLQPLKIETSHRLGRRFGNDRFIEISLPSLSGIKVPRLLRESGAMGRRALIKWLVHDLHEFLGITWKPFYVKNAASRKAKIDILATEEVDNTTRFCVFVFATDGIDFQTGETVPLRGEDSSRHTKMSINAMLNWLIPLEGNKGQSFLKLFQRIALGRRTINKLCKEL
jgi:RNA dependent RNA polymerase